MINLYGLLTSPAHLFRVVNSEGLPVTSVFPTYLVAGSEPHMTDFFSFHKK